MHRRNTLMNVRDRPSLIEISERRVAGA